MAKDTLNLLKFIPLFIGLLSLFLLFVNVKRFPVLGISVLLITILSITYSSLIKKYRFHLFYFVAAICFALFVFIRDESLLTIIDILAVIFLYSLMIIEKDNSEHKSIILYFTAPFLAFAQFVYLLPKKLLTSSDLNSDDRAQPAKVEFFARIGVQTFLAIIVLLVIVPILAQTNVFFSDLMDKLFKFLDLRFFVEFLFGEDIFDAVIRIFWFTVFACITWLAVNNKYTNKILIKEIAGVDVSYLRLARISSIIILAIYFITEIQLYFASKEVLIAMNYSNSMQTREIFAQLTVVSIIIFGLVYNQNKSKGLDSRLSLVLVLEAIFLNTIALSSDLNYIFNWGLTYNRLYGLAFVVWVYGIFGLFLVDFIAKTRPFTKTLNSNLSKILVAWTVVVVLAINIPVFDYLVYKYIPSTEKGQDHNYITTELGYTYLNKPEHFETLYRKYIIDCKTKIESKHKNDPDYYNFIEDYRDNVNNASWELSRIANVLQFYGGVKMPFYEQERFDIRSLNLSEYLTYLQVKNIDIEKLREQVDACEKY